MVIMKFWLGLKFALNIYIIASFITLLVLAVVNVIKKVTGRRSE
jgi:hypothetical protein